MIASQEALERENIRSIEGLKSSMDEGLENLSWDIQDVGRGISELNATFQLGCPSTVIRERKILPAFESPVYFRFFSRDKGILHFLTNLLQGGIALTFGYLFNCFANGGRAA